MSDNFILYADNDEFLMWQGRIGPYYIPSVDEAGNISWSNTAGLPNPPTQNIMGKGLNIIGIVADVSGLPTAAPNYAVYLVGEDDPYYGYMYVDGDWVNLGIIGRGEAAGFGTPTATIDANTGTPSVEVTASGPDTAKVFSFAFHNLRGLDGIGQPGTAIPEPDSADGAVGTSMKFAREEHSHRLNVSTTQSDIKMDGARSLGVLNTYARTDHIHASDTTKLNINGSSYSIKTSGNLNSFYTGVALCSGAVTNMPYNDWALIVSSGDSTTGVTQVAFSTFNAHAIMLRSMIGGTWSAWFYIDKEVLTNVSVPTSAWAADSTYEDFGYRATINLAGIVSNMIPEVVFSVADAMSGNFAPVCETASGKLYIYAAEVPSEAMTIPTIILWRGNV